MSVDLQVVYPQVLVPLTDIRVQSGTSPKVLEIIGRDFRAVDQVVINDIASPRVQVLSKTKLTAEVPSEVGTQEVSSVQVISNQLTLSGRSLLRFKLSPTPDRVSGILRLMQLYLKVLLTTPGKDIFSKKIGGGGMKGLGRSFGAGQGQSMVSNFVVAVSTTNRQLTAIQAQDPSIPREERLLSAKVTKATFSASQSALIVEIELRNQTGQTGIANLVL